MPGPVCEVEFAITNPGPNTTVAKTFAVTGTCPMNATQMEITVYFNADGLPQPVSASAVTNVEEQTWAAVLTVNNQLNGEITASCTSVPGTPSVANISVDPVLDLVVNAPQAGAEFPDWADVPYDIITSDIYTLKVTVVDAGSSVPGGEFQPTRGQRRGSNEEYTGKLPAVSDPKSGSGFLLYVSAYGPGGGELIGQASSGVFRIESGAARR